MGVKFKTVAKKKAKAKVASKQAAKMADTVDTYAESKLELNDRMAALSGLTKTVKDLDELLCKFVDGEKAPDDTMVLKGKVYALKVGAKGQRAVGFNKEFLLDKLGEEVFLELAQFSVTDLKRSLTGAEFAEAVQYSPVTKRRIEVLEP